MGTCRKGCRYTGSRQNAHLTTGGPDGFTLIEIIVVLALISIMLAFAVPRFQDVFQFDPIKKPSRWLLVKVPDLRYRALRDQQTYTLHVGISGNSLWTSHAAGPDEAGGKAEPDVYHLSDAIQLTGVVLANGKRQTADVVDIHFYPQGWADPAIIHMRTEDQDTLSFIIEPFLSSPVIVDGYQEFEDR